MRFGQYGLRLLVSEAENVNPWRDLGRRVCISDMPTEVFPGNEWGSPSADLAEHESLSDQLERCAGAELVYVAPQPAHVVESAVRHDRGARRHRGE